MADRGRLTPWPVREEIRRLRYEVKLTVRATAAIVGVNKETVCRWAPSKKAVSSSVQKHCSNPTT